MGDPRPGKIVDNIFLSIQQLKLKSTEVGFEGDMLVKDTGGFWRRADDPADAVINLGLAQARVDFDTTGKADGAVSIEAMVAPSYIYAIAGDSIKNGAQVGLRPSAIGGFDPAQTFIETLADELGASLVAGQFSRLATDSAGNNDAVLGDVIVVKLGVF